MIGNTDTRHYTQLSPNIYRFSPTYMYPGDPLRFHGVNERLSLKNWEDAVNFFYHLMVNADKAELDPMHTHGAELWLHCLQSSAVNFIYFKFMLKLHLLTLKNATNSSFWVVQS